MAFYVICDDDSKHESMTKEQILAAITQAIATGNIGDIDTGFVTKIKEKNGNGSVTLWTGTQAEYNAIASKEANCLYIITDDTTEAELNALVAKIQEYYAMTEAALPRVLVEGIDYGDTLPEAAVKGKIFFLSAEEE